MKTLLIILAALVALIPGPLSARETPALPTGHTTREVEGWKVRVDTRLLAGEDRSTGERALKLLAARLVAIRAVLPDEPLAKLRAIPIQLDREHGDLHSMQYHPNARWLTDHGYSTELAKHVHIPDVARFLSPFENHRMPWAVLHELAHGYHDQVLGFDDQRIENAWKKFSVSGKYASVLTSTGSRTKHYGLTDAKEFFAEMTESYLGSNDFHPFVAGELKEAEPEVFALMAEIWGPLPSPEAARPATD